jgi:hypothetical protein
MEERTADLIAIGELVERQSSGMGPDTAMFKSDFLRCAPLLPSARPVVVKPLDEFTEWLGELGRTSLTSLQERVVGTRLLAFDNVAEAQWPTRIRKNKAKSVAMWGCYC